MNDVNDTQAPPQAEGSGAAQSGAQSGSRQDTTPSDARQDNSQQTSAKPKRSRGRRGGRGRGRGKPAGDGAAEALSQSSQSSQSGQATQAGNSTPGATTPPVAEAAPANAEAVPPAKPKSRSRGRGKSASAKTAAKDMNAAKDPNAAKDIDASDDAEAAKNGSRAAPGAPKAPSARQPRQARDSGKSKAAARVGKSRETQDERDERDAGADKEHVDTKKKRAKKMFIGVLPNELVEVVLTEESTVQEYYVEMLHQAKTKGNIYKGYIHNIDSALQAAFINYGAERNGFLQIDEVHPEYYQGAYPLKKGARYPLIQKVLRSGQEVLVQVVKEPTGKKGAFVTCYLSLPGRYFVYTLGRDQQGVSRKIEDEKERERLKSAIEQIGPPEGVGLIVRTAGIGRAKTELVRDYKVLHRLWGEIKKKAQTEKAPALVYKELDLAVRAARDYLTPEVTEVWVDDPDTFEQIKDYVALAFPKSPNMVRLHADHDKTMWERFGLTRQVEQIYSREVTLPSGGRLVFDHTEALTSVDINSGKIGGEQSFARMAQKTNTEAAEEIVRQLKLRDIGGQIVIDFIEMKDPKHIRDVEKVVKQAMKNDRARTDVSGISPFGLMELVRQRLGSSAISVSTEPCPCCGGTGIRRNLEWQSLQAMKTIHRLLRRPGCPNPLQMPLGQELAIYMLNNKRELLTEMGARLDNRVEIVVDTKLP